jgi:hypothetical protein
MPKGIAVIYDEIRPALKDKCTNNPKVSVDVTSFEEWNCPSNQKYDIIYSAQAFQ